MAVSSAWRALGDAVAEMLELPPVQSADEIEQLVSRLLGGDGFNLSATSSDLIDGLTERTLTVAEIDGGETQCTICLVDLEPGEKVLVLGCNHIFHRPCILPWLQQQTTCPLCRHDIRKGDLSHESGGDGSRDAAGLGEQQGQGMNEALTLARMLARVVDPESSSQLPPNHPFNTTANPFATAAGPPAAQPAAEPAATGATAGSPQHAPAAEADYVPPLLFDDMPLD